jgi:hypothetical protein
MRPATTGDDDKALQAIATMIPVEVIAAYNSLIAVIPAAHVSIRFWLTVVMMPITALWIAFATKDGRIGWRQVIIAPFAFACWTCAIQGALLMSVFPWWENWIGSVAVGLGTLVLPILNGFLKLLGVPQN